MLLGITQFYLPTRRVCHTRKGRARLGTLHPKRITKRCCLFFRPRKDASPRLKTEFAKRAFRVAAPSIWNGLPVNIGLKSSQSVAVFKSRLITFLFYSAY